MTTLTNVTLDLFLFDIREGLGQSKAEITENREQFKQKLPNINSAKFDQIDDQYVEPEYQELLAGRTIDFEFGTSQGYYYPVRLNDIYGLLIECELLQEQSIDHVMWIENLQKIILSKLNKQTSTMGETWLLSAQMNELSERYCLEIAQSCCTILINNNQIKWSPFLDGYLFECWIENQHVIIIFYQHEKNEKRIADLYPYFMRLLAYHHKIMWAYRQGKNLKQLLKNKAIETEKYRTELNSYMEQRFNTNKFQQTLQGTWKILSKYDILLNNLSYQIRTIDTNHRNYDKRLATIEAEFGQKITCLSNFSDKTKNKYLFQVQTDYTNLSPELASLEHMINYIRASVAIEEEKRERSFQNTIATWGIGLAAGAIVASISGLFPDDITGWFLYEFFEPKWWKAMTAIEISCISAIGAGLITKLVMVVKTKFG
ncbi:hypothetical protein QUF74_11930 [Candidatus Halobeggiatoa sp. HSG11]|nr:hypothetical protein [Candidatus Halobeggiatoa sp. HSG11]